ncbi:hypothetical protein J3A83DRAFT_4194306 [Scleroderma citrinum]
MTIDELLLGPSSLTAGPQITFYPPWGTSIFVCTYTIMGVTFPITSLNVAMCPTSTTTTGIFGPGMATPKLISCINHIPTINGTPRHLHCYSVELAAHISKFSNDFNTTWMDIEPPTTKLEKAQQFALLLTDVSKPTLAPLNPADDVAIIAAYNHYANTLVEASWQYWILLERREKLEAIRHELQDDHITGMETKKICFVWIHHHPAFWEFFTPSVIAV